MVTDGLTGVIGKDLLRNHVLNQLNAHELVALGSTNKEYRKFIFGRGGYVYKLEVLGIRREIAMGMRDWVNRVPWYSLRRLEISPAREYRRARETRINASSRFYRVELKQYEVELWQNVQLRNHYPIRQILALSAIVPMVYVIKVTYLEAGLHSGGASGVKAFLLWSVGAAGCSGLFTGISASFFSATRHRVPSWYLYALLWASAGGLVSMM